MSNADLAHGLGLSDSGPRKRGLGKAASSLLERKGTGEPFMNRRENTRRWLGSAFLTLALSACGGVGVDEGAAGASGSAMAGAGGSETAGSGGSLGAGGSRTTPDGGEPTATGLGGNSSSGGGGRRTEGDD